MKLKHIITPNKTALIEYRTKGPNGEDLFAGECRYKDGELIPCDGDSYSLEDEISHYEIAELPCDYQIITVWYESEWVCG